MDRELLSSIPLGSRGGDDVLMWHFDCKGLYSVRSGYKLEMTRRSEGCVSGPGTDVAWWKKLWACHVPSKVKIHVWRSFHDSLVVKMNLAFRRLSYSTNLLVSYGSK